MVRDPAACLLVFVLSPLLPAHPQNAEEQTLAELAPKIKFVCAGDVALGRVTSLSAGYPEYEHQMRALAIPSLRFENLLPLLHHPDAKIRTLAIIALSDKNDPRMLPAVVALADDHSPTYSCPRALALIPGMIVDPWPMSDQKVAQIASAVVNTYLDAAAFNYGIKSTPSYPGFEGYWATHKDLSYSGSWFVVRSNRADAGTIKTIRNEIAGLPEPDRQWELFWVATRRFYRGDEQSFISSDTELLEACKRLGRDRLLQMLAGRLASTDPDLQPRYNKYSPYKHMMLFVLRHSDELLKPEDAPTLLLRQDENLGLAQRDVEDPFDSPWWAIGAAQLDPKHAGRPFRDQVRSGLVLWRAALLWHNASRRVPLIGRHDP
jgi:hypothetical protein